MAGATDDMERPATAAGSRPPVDEHDIAGVHLTATDGRFVIHCPCGWESTAQRHVSTAVTEWQRHRDHLIRLT